MRPCVAFALLTIAAGCNSGPLRHPISPTTNAGAIVAEARKQAQESTVYNASYVRIPYPNGDVPRGQGACTDVIIRCLRPLRKDLQLLIHEDIMRRPSSYAKAKQPDKNIDHRRVTNQIVYFTRQAKKLSVSTLPQNARNWKPGDFVFWKLDNGRDHCGVLTDSRNADGLPLVVHNLWRCAEEDCLTKWKIVAHFRYP